MKKKYTTYFLLFALLIVWGIIFYRIIKYISEQKELPLSNPKEVRSVQKEVRDSVVLDLNYPDPFSGELNSVLEPQLPAKANYSNRYAQKHKDTTTKIIKTDEKILYKGEITNKTSSSKVYIISVNGKTRVLSNNKNDSIFIVNDLKESLMINYKGNIKQIKK
jgi:hypothetical protein